MPSIAARSRKPASATNDWARSALFLLGVALAALLTRSLVAMPRSIPSESMLPRLLVGDDVLVAKWPYGWSRFSLPWAPPAPRGRLMGRLPARGDVVVFRAPPDDARDFIKRVIGLPGDVVQLRAGRLWLNGRPVPRARIADLVVPMTGAEPCMTIAGLAPGLGAVADAAGHPVCRLPRYRERLPGGRAFEVVDQGASAGDDFGPARVPAGHVFLLGDNRDMSEDSRFAPRDGGVGMVPVDNLEGRAAIVFFSHDGRPANWNPLAWARGVRPARIGGSFG